MLTCDIRSCVDPNCLGPKISYGVLLSMEMLVDHSRSRSPDPESVPHQFFHGKTCIHLGELSHHLVGHDIGESTFFKVFQVGDILDFGPDPWYWMVILDLQRA